MRILIANDDGIYSPGIACLARVASKFGEVRMVAPDVERSSASGAISSMPLTIKKTPLPGMDAWRVNGTPADCVAVGCFNWEHVDLVLSGINLGLNIGNALWHSGTLAAAKQAALLGIRGIAFSAPADGDEPDFGSLAPHVEKVLELLLPEDGMKLVNVNLPTKPAGLSWTRQSVRHYDGRIVPGKDPMGRTHYWFTVSPIEDVEEGSDRWAISQKLISLTPLRIDLTDEDALARMRGAEATRA